MVSLAYLYSKFFKKILRGKSIVSSNVDKTAKVYSGCSIVKSNIGKYSYIGYDCEIINCEVGAFCSVASNVYIGGAEHPIDWVSTSPVFQNVKHSGPVKRFARLALPKSKTTYVGNDVWIGHGAVIKAGVKIGHGAVVAAGAVVTKDIEPYSVVGGCPAKLIKKRFSADIIQELLETSWWSLGDDVLKRGANCVNDPRQFLDALKKQ